jgi:hypothetical protein
VGGGVGGGGGGAAPPPPPHNEPTLATSKYKQDLIEACCGRGVRKGSEEGRCRDMMVTMCKDVAKNAPHTAPTLR